MSAGLLFAFVIGYFILLLIVAWYTSRNFVSARGLAISPYTVTIKDLQADPGHCSNTNLNSFFNLFICCFS